MYFAYIRDYGEKDQAVVGYLTKDISDKIPPQKLERIRRELEEEKKMNGASQPQRETTDGASTQGES